MFEIAIKLLFVLYFIEVFGASNSANNSEIIQLNERNEKSGTIEEI